MPAGGHRIANTHVKNAMVIDLCHDLVVRSDNQYALSRQKRYNTVAILKFAGRPTTGKTHEIR